MPPNENLIPSVVDDIVVIDHVDVQFCADAIERYRAYAFYLRMGKNITQCYMLRMRTPPHFLSEAEQELYSWSFRQGLGDWRYPNSVDMTLFNKNMLLRDVSHMQFSCPNTFEAQWAKRANLRLTGLCFEKSKSFNIPMNRVQTTFKHNRHMGLYSSEFLLKKYLDDYKIDIDIFKKIDNNTVHFEVSPQFIKR
jgi:hypothetical protein